jgi:polysaccharide export outer membrane protein
LNLFSNNALYKTTIWALVLSLLSTLVPPSLYAQGSDDSSKPAKVSTTKTSSTNVDYPKLVIGPGDLLQIEVYGENGSTGTSIEMGMSVNTQLPTDYQVDSDGVIFFPFLGRVNLAGLTAVQAGEKIAVMLSKPRKVTVLIKESNTYWVSVLGNVGKPGRYQIQGTPTLLSALAQAGGPLPDTDFGGTILIHDNYKSKLDLNRYLQGEGKMDPEPYLYPGDTIMVKQSPWPSWGEIAIVASILASAAIVTVELSQLHH